MHVTMKNPKCANCRSVVAGYTLYRTDIHPVAQHILGTAMGNSVSAIDLAKNSTKFCIAQKKWNIIWKKNTTNPRFNVQNVFYIGRYLLAELRVRYWAFGPEFDKRLVSFNDLFICFLTKISAFEVSDVKIKCRYPGKKRLQGALASEAADLDGWWCGNRALTPTDRNESTPYVKKAKDRIHQEHKLAD